MSARSRRAAAATPAAVPTISRKVGCSGTQRAAQAPPLQVFLKTYDAERATSAQATMSSGVVETNSRLLASDVRATDADQATKCKASDAPARASTRASLRVRRRKDGEAARHCAKKKGACRAAVAPKRHEARVAAGVDGSAANHRPPDEHAQTAMSRTNQAKNEGGPRCTGTDTGTLGAVATSEMQGSTTSPGGNVVNSCAGHEISGSSSTEIVARDSTCCEGILQSAWNRDRSRRLQRAVLVTAQECNNNLCALEGTEMSCEFAWLFLFWGGAAMKRR